MRESLIEKKVCDFAKSLGLEVYKFTSPSRAAVPDRLFICKGRHVFIEFKATGKKVTPAQDREHKRLRAAGATVYVVDSVTEGERIIRDTADVMGRLGPFPGVNDERR